MSGVKLIGSIGARDGARCDRQSRTRSFGWLQICGSRTAAGVDGVWAGFRSRSGRIRGVLACRRLETISFETTPPMPDQKAAELGRGFLYGISRLGVTGARDQVASGAEALVRRIRAHTDMPVALGFGISRPEHVAEVGAYADAAVVGSALVSLIAEASGSPRLIGRVEDYVRELKSACVTTRT